MIVVIMLMIVIREMRAMMVIMVIRKRVGCDEVVSSGIRRS